MPKVNHFQLSHRTLTSGGPPLILQGLLEIFSPFFQVFVYNDSNCIEICRFLTASIIFIFVQIKEVHYAHIHRDHYGPPVPGQYTPGRAEHETAL